MIVKDRLRSLRNEVIEIKKLQEKRDWMWNSLLPKAIIISKDKVQTSNPTDTIGDKLAEVSDLEKIIEQRIKKLVANHIEMEKLINKLEDSRYRLVLELYYLSTRRMTWDEVAQAMGYSTAEIYKVHGRALQELELFCKSV